MASKRNRWRCGNFVVRRVDVPTFGEDEWRLSEGQVRRRVKKGEIGTVEAYEVMSLDGAWSVRLMPGSHMETMLVSVLDEEKKVDDEWVELVCTNLMMASSIPNGYYHQALMLLTAVYADPTLITGGPFSKKKREFLRDCKKVRDGFLEWRKDYDAFLESQPDDTDEQLLRLDAEEALDEE